MSTKKSFKKVGTHHGRFHADEVMATAILKGMFEIELIRTRDPKILSELDIVYDVGGGEFDHHGVEKVCRDDGIPFAACGLIWRKFGRGVIQFKDPSLSEEDIESVFQYVDRVLIKGVDALDNGIRTGDGIIPTMNISSIISGFNPPWYSEKSDEEAFNEAVDTASVILENTINRRLSVLKSEEIVLRAYKSRIIPEVLILDTFCPWGETLGSVDEKEEVLFIVYPRKDDYAMQTVRDKDGKDRKYLPKSWAGKMDEELVAITGVRDSVFCHTGRFIAVARSFKGIMKMAQLAINEPQEVKEGRFFRFITRLFSRR
ncbi:metal-dependent hydrolase [Anaeromicrobium sediminis]|uniref:Metal-dependent hydrolase n=1 Tax=Anaeromicrobium sediminis TaxID=1478221 RepID=A0A267MC56_9FIRM|nr:metal-dependent hydrolase [Anaeromicrobium sediminis]